MAAYKHIHEATDILVSLGVKLEKDEAKFLLRSEFNLLALSGELVIEDCKKNPKNRVLYDRLMAGQSAMLAISDLKHP